MELNTAGLTPLDTSKLRPVNTPKELDTSSLKPLDTSSLKPIAQQSTTSLTPPTEETSFFGSFDIGRHNLASAGLSLGALYDLEDKGELADSIASHNKRARELQSAYPEDIKQGIAEITEAPWYKVPYEAATNPRSVGRLIGENLLYSVPALVGAKGGSMIGGAAGAAGGSVVPIVGTGIGGSVGAVVGGIGGAFIGSTATEIGAWTMQALEERGYDTTDANRLREAFNNPDLMDEIRGEAERKGLTTSAVDAVFNLTAGRYLKGSTGSGLARRAVAGAKDTGIQAVGESTSEFAGQIAAYQGDLSKVSANDVVLEGILTLPQSVGETAIGYGIRNTIGKNREEQDKEQTMRPSTRDELKAMLESDKKLDEIKAEQARIDTGYDVLSPEEEAPKPLNYRDTLTQMDEAQLVEIYKGKNKRNSHLAKAELDARFPQFDVAKDIDIEQAAAETAPEPTEAQKEAGNYKKGHVRFKGLDVTIENARGSVRSGVDSDGEAWNVTMPANYGYIKRTKGADGDHVDVYVGQNAASDNVYVIDQIDPVTGEFDEHKVMLGYDTLAEAHAAYNGAFSDGKASQRAGDTTLMNVKEFKDWLNNGNTKQPLSYQKPAQGDLFSQQQNGITPEGRLNFQAGEGEEAQVGEVTRRTPSGVTRTEERERIILPKDPKSNVDRINKAKWERLQLAIENERVADSYRDDLDPAKGFVLQQLLELERTALSRLTTTNRLPKGRFLYEGADEGMVQTYLEQNSLTQREGQQEEITPADNVSNEPEQVIQEQEQPTLTEQETEVTPAQNESKDELGSEEFRSEMNKVIAENLSKANADEIAELSKTTIVLNSKGELISGTAKQIKAFWEWFGDSKVVDAEGRPLVVYHGTNAKFDTFSQDNIGDGDGRSDWGDGFYFSTERAAAEGYGKNIAATYLKIVSPADNAVMLSDEVQKAIYDDMGFKTVQEVLDEQGHDGVAYTHRGQGVEFVVFEPEQARIASWETQGDTSNSEGNNENQATVDDNANTAPSNKASAEVFKLEDMKPEAVSMMDTIVSVLRIKKTPEVLALLEKGATIEKVEMPLVTTVIAYIGDRTKSDTSLMVDYAPILQYIARNPKEFAQRYLDKYQQAAQTDTNVAQSNDEQDPATTTEPQKTATSGEDTTPPDTTSQNTDKSSANDTNVATKKETASQRKARLKDVGEKMAGKRAQEKQEIDKSSGAEAAKKIMNATEKAKLVKQWKIAEDATDGVKAYVQLLSDSIAPFSSRFLDKFGSRSKSRYRKVKGWKEQVEGLFNDETPIYQGVNWSTDERSMEMIREKRENIKQEAADYITMLETFGEIVKGVSTVKEMHQAMREAMLDDPTGDTGWNNQNDFFRTFKMRYAAASGKSYYLLEGMVGENKYTTFGDIKDETEDKKRTSVDKKLIREKLETVQREQMQDHRNGEDVTPEKFRQRFGFRGVEFGEWVNADEGQAHLNHAYDAFMDMADRFQMPYNAVSLGGRLGLAFGSRGKGRASAHFEPQNMVINITKTRGDGSLSHEWSHALDHVLQNTSTDAERVVRNIKKYLAHGVPDLEALRDRVKGFLKGYSYYQGMKSAGQVANAKRFIQNAKINAIYTMTNTQFKKEADALGKDYWGNPEELWARSFEAFVYDTLGGKSPYLVSNWVQEGYVSKDAGFRGKPYPEKVEREQFSTMYDELMRSLTWDEKGNPTLNKDYVDPYTKANTERDTILSALEDELPKMAKEIEDAKRATGQSSGNGQGGLQDGVSAGDGGARTTDEAGTARRGGTGTAGDGSNQRGGGDVSQSGEQGGGTERGEGSGISRDDTVPTREDVEYAVQAVGELPDYQGGGINHSIAVGALEETRSQKQKALDNIKIIKLVQEIEASGRTATADEQKLLAKYTGWGSAKNVFPNSKGEFKDGWKDVGTQLQNLLTPTEYEVAKRTTQYAHFTSEVVTRSMWKAMQQFGFKGGKVFEAGMGIGNFAGMIPHSIKEKTSYSGIEVDPMTTRVARLLYPQSSVRLVDFTEARYPDNMFDASIGNPPFSDVKISSDPKYASDKLSLHNYFFVKSMDMVAEGGVAAFVTSRYFMDALNPEARKKLLEKSDLVGAIRLPNTAFKTNSHTDVVTDIIFLRKRLPNETAPTVEEAGWVNVKEAQFQYTNRERDADGNISNIETKFHKAAINEYFAKRPEMILGDQNLHRGMYSENEYTVMPVEGKQLSAQLEEALSELPENIITKVEKVDTSTTDFEASENKEGSYYLKGKQLMQIIEGVGKPIEKRGAGVKGGMTAKDIEKVTALVGLRDALRATLKAMRENNTSAITKAQQALSTKYDAFVKKHGALTKAERTFRKPTAAAIEKARDELRNDYLEAGVEFDEGSVDLSDLIGKNNPATGRNWTPTELANKRQEMIDELEAAGQPVDHGTFDPTDVPDSVSISYPNLDVFREDPEVYNLMILEKYDEDKNTYSKKDIFRKNIIAQDADPQINTAVDALNYSLATHNGVDIEFIAKKYGKNEKEVIEELESQDIIYAVPDYENPDRKIWTTADKYLSGKVKAKLEHAKRLAATDPYYKRNVAALEEVQPADIPVSDISTSLGASYFTDKVIEGFMESALELTSSVRHIRTGNVWTVNVHERYNTNNTHTYGTKRMTAEKIMEALLVKRPIVVYDTIWEEDGKEKRVLNTDETEAAKEKSRAIQDKFDNWIWKSDFATEVHRRYNDVFNDTIVREYDGKHLTPTHSPVYTLRKHQKNFVWRVLQDGNAYAAHAVGAGKTLAMVVAGMEMKRLGMAKKPMYVVPNHMLAQFAGEFKEAYPQANVYVADEFKFHADRRRQFVAQVAGQDWDAVVITYSAFKKIPVSREFEAEMVQSEIDRYMRAYQEAGGRTDDLTETGKFARGYNRSKNDPSVARVQKQIEKLKERLKRLANLKQDQNLSFEELGIDHLIVDEAHYFRKLSFPTMQGNIRGVQPQGSKQSWDLYSKVKYLDTIKPHRNLILASGTPLTNTVAEVFTVQRFMNEQELIDKGIDNFDAWASSFATTVTNLEKQPSGSYADVTRLAKFTNLQSLSMMTRAFMDVVTSKELGEAVDRPAIKGGKMQIRTEQPTPKFKSYQKFLEKRMQAIQQRQGKVKAGDDIILTVINDGRHAAIDMRLIDPTLPQEQSKLENMIDNIYKTYTESSGIEYVDDDGNKQKLKGGTQLVFSDLGVTDKMKGNHKFSAYRHIRRRLIDMGVPENEIAFMRDYKKSDEKRRLFNQVRNGEVRILIGSTANMGTGVNVQRRIVAIHNLDAPWLPADLEQRIGRGERQGNQNKEVAIYGYGTEGSYDSTMWGILETKSNAIEQFLSGKNKTSEMDDISDTNNFRLAKALTSGDPRVLQQAQLIQELTTLERKASGFTNEQVRIKSDIASKKSAIERNKEKIKTLTTEVKTKIKDISGDNFEITIGGRTFTSRDDAGKAVLERVSSISYYDAGGMKGDGVPLGEFAGLPLRLFASQKDPVSRMMQFDVFFDAPHMGHKAYIFQLPADNKAFSAVGMVSRLTNILKEVDADVQLANEYILSAERAIKTLESNKATDFPQQNELEQKRAELEELDQDLRENKMADETVEEWPEDLPQSGSFRFQSDDVFDIGAGYKFNKNAGGVSQQQRKKQIVAALRKRMEELGFDGKIALQFDIDTLPQGRQYTNVRDTLNKEGWGGYTGVAGMYLNKSIYVALDNRDPIGTLNHEAIHALKNMGVFTEREWKMLEARAEQSWIKKYNIEKLYPPETFGANPTSERVRAGRREEAIAQAFADYATSSDIEPSWFQRLKKRVQNFFKAIKEAMFGLNIQTPEDLFDYIERGQMSRRSGTEQEQEDMPRFFKLPSDVNKALEQATATLDEAMTDDRKVRPVTLDDRMDIDENVLLEQTIKGYKARMPKDLGHMAALIAHPAHIASTQSAFTPIYRQAINQFEMRDEIVAELTNFITGYNKLDGKGKEKVNAALEIGRLNGETFSGDTITFTNEEHQDAVFTALGETITLNEQESEAYKNVRQGFDFALDLYVNQILDDYGYIKKGINTKSELMKAAAREPNKNEAGRMNNVVDMISEIEEAKRKGYIPFKRWGDVGIVVKRKDAEKSPDEWETVFYEQLDTKSVPDRLRRFVKRKMGQDDTDMLGKQPNVQMELSRLMKRYPAAEYEIKTFPVSQFADLEGKVSLTDLDILAASSDMTQDEYALMRDQIEQAMKQRGFKSHFFKSQNVAGYSPDFERAINDYVVGIAGHLARRRYAPRIDKAISNLAKRRVNPRLVNYAKKYATYIQNPVEEFQWLRQWAFFKFISGNFSTAMINLTQVPLVTLPIFTAQVGAKQANVELAKAYKDVVKMFNPKDMGLDVFNPDKAPDDIRQVLLTAWEKGYFVPLNTYEAMAISNTSVASMRGLSRMARRAMDVISIKFSAAERTNRLATFIAAYRIAQKPENRFALEEYLQGDFLAKADVLDNNLSPLAFAEYMTMQTQLRMSRANRPSIARGIGVIPFQFKSFMLQMLELQLRLVTRHGKRGQRAFAYLMMALIFFSGLKGLPFEEELESLIEKLYKLATKTDLDIETEVRSFMVKELAMPHWLVETIMTGAAGALLNVDLSYRLGFGNVAPDRVDDLLGAPWAAVVQPFEHAAIHIARGDNALAFAEFMPSFIANPIKASLMPEEGIKSRTTGDTVIPPEQITNYDVALRSLGFNSQDIGLKRKEVYAQQRANRAANELRANYYDRLAYAMARKVRAVRRGDAEASQKYENEFSSIMEELQRRNEGKPVYKQVIINHNSLRQRIEEELRGAAANSARRQARSRAEEIKSIYGAVKE